MQSHNLIQLGLCDSNLQRCRKSLPKQPEEAPLLIVYDGKYQQAQTAMHRKAIAQAEHHPIEVYAAHAILFKKTMSPYQIPAPNAHTAAQFE